MLMKPSLLPLALLVSLAVTGLARAETSPYYIGASVAVNYDSNVFRTPEAQRRSDFIYGIGLLGGFDQTISRQRVYGSAVVRNNRFSKLSEQNNTSYGLNAGLDWATIEKLSGSVTLAADSNLINYGGTNTNLGTERILSRSNQASASVQYGGASLLVLQGSYTHRTLGYSNDAYQQANGLTQDAVSAGLSYRPSAGLVLGSAIRHTRGDYANGSNSFSRNDLDLTGTWQPTGQSTVSSRLSLTRQTTDGAVSAAAFNGATGFLSWVYQPTGKLQFNTWISRDTGAESSFFKNNNDLPVQGDNSQFTNTVALDGSYAATAKIRLTAGLRTASRSLVNSGFDGSDTVNGANIGATYQALRNVSFSCNLARESRSNSGIGSSAYNATFGGCSAQVTLQ